MEGDITSKESLLSIVEVVKARHGYIDLLINNAGVARNFYQHPLPTPATSSSLDPPSPPSSPMPNYEKSAPSIKAFQKALWDIGTMEEWEESFRTNSIAVYYTTVAFLELLHRGNARKLRLERGPSPAISRSNSGTDTPSDSIPASGIATGESFGGRPYHSSQVISVSSSGGFRTDHKVLSPSYTLSKAACTHLGKLMANLLASWGIRSNVLAPGVWPTGEFILNFFFSVELLVDSYRIDMTTQPTPDITLSPSQLASVVPLKRVGTDEVGFIGF